LTGARYYRYLLSVNLEIVSSAGEKPKKLANFLKNRFPIGYVRRLFRKSGVKLNGKHARPDDRVQPGDTIQLFIPFENRSGKETRRKPEPRFEVIFEDPDLVVLDKPPGIAVQEGRETPKRDSIIGLLEAKYSGQGVTPKLAHRLDRDTSGLLLVAKNERTLRELEESFASAQIDKEYICLVAGRLHESEGKIDFPLTGRGGSQVRASTRFRVIKRFPEVTLLRVWIDTGRMHQIRLHFAKLGYPVVMDDQHGDFRFNKKFRKNYGLKRQFLHATRLTLQRHGKKKTWKAPLPGDLNSTLQSLDESFARGI
jgi:23S rRNA pseudouridine955/2504/2580 synthase